MDQRMVPARFPGMTFCFDVILISQRQPVVSLSQTLLGSLGAGPMGSSSWPFTSNQVHCIQHFPHTFTHKHTEMFYPSYDLSTGVALLVHA